MIPATVALLWAGLFASASFADSVRVKVDGVGGELKGNVLKTLSIVQAQAEGDDLAEGRIRRLHQRAEAEIAEALAPFGYYRATVRSSLEREEASGAEWIASYEVDPGPELRVNSFKLSLVGEGSTDDEFERLVREFPLAEGDVLHQPGYEAGKATFENYAAFAGYLDARFETAQIRIDRRAYTSRVVMVFDTGPRFEFGEVTFEQDFLEPDLLRGFVTLEPGDPFDLREVLKLQNTLSDSPYFARVEVIPDREAAEGRRVQLRVALTPSARQKWTAGIGYGTDTGPRGRLGLEVRRVNRRGHQAEGRILGSGIEQSFVADYRVPGSYPRTDVVTYSLGYRFLDTDSSQSETGIAGVGLTRSRGKWREAYGLTFQREDFEVGLDSGISDLLIPSTSWSLTKADDRIFPRNGRHVEFRLEGAIEDVLSDTTFLRGRADAKYVRSLSSDVRVLARASVGLIETDAFRSLPPTLRYFAGGDQSVRGYGYQELGPQDEAGNVIGGEALVLASIEADYFFYERFGRWGLAVFYDAGNALDKLSFDLKSGVGAGMRWLSPIGLVRADVGFPLESPPGSTGRDVTFHLTIGPDL
ncbi:MAG: autotransporter assembly complex protein TamA [Thermoanaerobaculia bacterium]|nr:autotransporter assembly complex protein TamA [Thermoanaerobaculia bacterium]